MQHRITTIHELSYISINAESGCGKSDLVRSIAEILPADVVKIGTASAKFLPRMGEAWDGKIIFLDDQQPDADNIEYMKICGVNTTIRPTYGTLIPGAKGEPAYKPEELPLPIRLCFIIARVDTAWGADAATHEPIIYASKDDAIPVIDMFNSFLTIPDNNVPADPNAGGNVYKFSRAEKRVHDAILQKYHAYGWRWKSVRAMADDLGIDRETTRTAVNGRKTTLKTDETTGLLSKMPGLDIERESKTSEGGDNDNHITRSYNVIVWDPYAYQQDREKRKIVIAWND